MSALTNSTLLRCAVTFVIGGAFLACGGKKDPVPEEGDKTEKVDKTDKADKADKSEAESTKKDEPDATEAAADADGEAGKRRNARDRMATRRPPLKRHGEDADAEGGDSPGATGDKDASAPSVAGADAAAKGEGPDAASAAPPDIAKKPDPGGDAKSAPDAVLPSDTKEPPDPRNNAAQPAVTQPGVTQPVAVRPGGPLDAVALLPLQLVSDVTQAKGLVDVGPIPGIATGAGYVSILYRGAAADKFGVALQAWQDPARRESDDRFRRMRLQYPNAEDVQVLQPVKAFFAHFSGIQMLTFVDSVKRVVATVSCAEDVCTHEQLTNLAKTVREHL